MEETIKEIAKNKDLRAHVEKELIKLGRVAFLSSLSSHYK